MEFHIYCFTLWWKKEDDWGRARRYRPLSCIYLSGIILL